MSDLRPLPCPFCEDDMSDMGAANEDAYFATSSDGAFSVNCGHCQAIGPEGPSRAHAIANWNRRALLSSAEQPNEQERVMTSKPLLPTGQGEGLREALKAIWYGYGANHTSKFCRDAAERALAEHDDAILSTIRGEQYQGVSSSRDHERSAGDPLEGAT